MRLNRKKRLRRKIVTLESKRAFVYSCFPTPQLIKGSETSLKPVSLS